MFEKCFQVFTDPKARNVICTFSHDYYAQRGEKPLPNISLAQVLMVVPRRLQRQRDQSRFCWWIVSEVAWYVVARMRETAYRPLPQSQMQHEHRLLVPGLDFALVIHLI